MLLLELWSLLYWFLVWIHVKSLVRLVNIVIFILYLYWLRLPFWNCFWIDLPSIRNHLAISRSLSLIWRSCNVFRILGVTLGWKVWVHNGLRKVCTRSDWVCNNLRSWIWTNLIEVLNNLRLNLLRKVRMLSLVRVLNLSRRRIENLSLFWCDFFWIDISQHVLTKIGVINIFFLNWSLLATYRPRRVIFRRSSLID